MFGILGYHELFLINVSCRNLCGCTFPVLVSVAHIVNFTELAALPDIPYCLQILQENLSLLHYYYLFILLNIFCMYSNMLPSYCTFSECMFCVIRLIIVHLCVSEFPPSHLAVWYQVKHTCCSMNLPIIVHTYNEKCQGHFFYG